MSAARNRASNLDTHDLAVCPAFFQDDVLGV
jgi:hypothetical protein